MLLRFRVENWASLRDEQELSLIAADQHDDLALREVPGTDFRVLPAVGVFGANASGKSQLMYAMFYARSAVLESHQRWEPNGSTGREPFRLDQARSTEPTTFVFDLVAEGVRYEYGFALDDTRVLEEWLFSWPQGRIRRVFERFGPGARDVVAGPTLRKGYGTRTRTAIEAVRPNSLLVSAGAANSHPLLTVIYEWFRRIGTAHDGNSFERLDFTLQKLGGRYASQMRRLLQLADLGITGIRSEERKVPEEVSVRFSELMRLIEPEHVSDHKVEIRRMPKIMVAHETSDGEVELPYARESSGTRTWLEMLGPVMEVLAEGRVLIVDELDARLHPNLAGQLVRLFQEPEINRNGAQLVFNTHDATLLSRNSYGRLTRDQVWFTQKGRDGATELIALKEYKEVRDDRGNLLNQYLLGRFGAVPYFDDDFLPQTYEIEETGPLVS